MNYEQTVEKLFSLQKFGIKLGLSSTENLLAGLGNPHLGLPVLHLAGTNGKGSVGATVNAILTEAGYKVGFYTSPHLVSFRERFAIGRTLISEDDVVRLAGRVWAVCAPQEPPTFFEFVTAMAFLYFAEAGVDLAVMETGLGGRLDATNVSRPLVSVITNISLEHTEYLGPTLSDIAREKAGIIKPGAPVVTGEKRPGILGIFSETARAAGTELLIAGKDFQTRRKPDGSFKYFGLKRRIGHLVPALRGSHQVGNAGLALAALELLEDHGLKAGDEAIRQGLRTVFWPGRGEIIPGYPRIMLDGAHNPSAARVLARLLPTVFHGKLHIVMGVMADKDIDGVMAPLLPLADELYLTRPEYSRAAEPEALAGHAGAFKGRIRLFRHLPAAIEAARSEAGPDDLVLITGSLFTVGEARGYLLGS